jgi:hypothetical protein
MPNDNDAPLDAFPDEVISSVYVLGTMNTGFLLSDMADMLSTLISGTSGSESMKSPSTRARQTP